MSDNECVGERFAYQPQTRFPVGSTYFLPAVGSGCDAAWVLESAPSGNDNAIVVGSDGRARFTPHVFGEYRFRLGSSEEVVGVIDSADVPFHNYNYYPSRSQVLVDGELWVANGFSPTLTSIDTGAMRANARLHVGGWPVSVGWVDGMDVAVVAQRADDTLGFVDVEARHIVDAVYVGDEPANVVVSPDGATAYVALQTEGVVAVVDIAAREVVERIDAGRSDLLGMALSVDGDTLFVAGHRTGDDARDIVVIDTANAAVDRTIENLGTTIKALYAGEDGRTLYVSQVRNDTDVSLGDPDMPSFIQEILAVDIDSGQVTMRADLSRQDTSLGAVVSLHSMVEAGDRLWVASEGYDELIGLDPVTLEERVRYNAPGRPRDVIARGATLFVHGVQDFVVTAVNVDGTERAAISTGEDPRPAKLADGQRLMTGAGNGYATNWSCNSCHADGLSDTMAWNAGPFEFRSVTRPFFWLDGTYPIGWEGYVSRIQITGFVGGSTINTRPVTEGALALNDYLMSLSPPPVANGYTERDGSHTEQALRGKELFEGSAGCFVCHGLPLATTRQVFDDGITPGVSDVPSLVGVYRHNVWLKDGSALTLRDGVAAAVEWLDGPALSDADVDDLTRYIAELTGRDFFALATVPRDGDEVAAVDQPIVISFSLPVHDTAQNLAGISLVDANGNDVPATTTVDGPRVIFEPSSDLDFGASYEIVVAPELEAFDERLAIAATFAFTTAHEPAVALEGDFTWTVNIPVPDFVLGEFDPDTTIPYDIPVSAAMTASGADLTIDYGQDMVYRTHAVIDGDTIMWPDAPVPAGNSFAQAWGGQVTIVDDAVDATARISGPGFDVASVAWALRPYAAPGECDEGVEGAVVVAVTGGDDEVVIDWDGEDDGLALYVTDPLATIPMGPGTSVMGGDTYWAVAVESFPTGFARPVVYGEIPDGGIDDGATHDARFEELVAGKCYKFSVVTTGFQSGALILRWPSDD